jgi:hypothetical protein
MGASTYPNPYGSPRPVTGKVLPFLVCNLFNDAVNIPSYEYITRNDWIILNDELRRRWNGVVVD